MPFNSHTQKHTPIYLFHHDKHENISLQDSPYGNIFVNASHNNSMNSQKKLSIPNCNNTQNQSKPSIHHLTRRKSVAAKLFSKAKLISNSKRQTFLSRSPNSSTEQKKIRFLRVAKPSTCKKQSPKKRKSGAGVESQKVIQEYYIQPETYDADIHKKDLKYISKKHKFQDVYKFDEEDAQIVKRENMFTSSMGQIMLKKLVGKNVSPKETKSDKTITTRENSTVRKNSDNDFCVSIPKVAAFELDDEGVEISKIKAKNGDTSFFHEIKDDYKAKQNLSKFSVLIMEDKLQALKSNELSMSKSSSSESESDDSDTGELSLMSRQ